VCFIVHKTTLELERGILTTLYFAGAENTNIFHPKSEIQIYPSYHISNKAFQTKWPKMGNRQLMSKAKLKRGQIQEQA
jgi:hypothetical protein